MSDDTRGGALFIYPAPDYRYGVSDTDVPGMVTLVYEEWNVDEKRWDRKGEFPGMLEPEQLVALGEAGLFLAKWEEGDTEPATVTVTVQR